MLSHVKLYKLIKYMFLWIHSAFIVLVIVQEQCLVICFSLLYLVFFFWNLNTLIIIIIFLISVSDWNRKLLHWHGLFWGMHSPLWYLLHSLCLNITLVCFKLTLSQRRQKLKLCISFQFKKPPEMKLKDTHTKYMYTQCVNYSEFSTYIDLQLYI